METDLKVLLEVSHYLTDKEARLQAREIDKAVDEIDRLRAGQFRWIAVSERKPTFADGYGAIGFVLTILEGGSVGMTSWEHVRRANYTHWAPIPPLPERTQEEKDEALWDALHNIQQFDHCAYPAKSAFLAGLKAARGEK